MTVIPNSPKWKVGLIELSNCPYSPAHRLQRGKTSSSLKETEKMPSPQREQHIGSSAVKIGFQYTACSRRACLRNTSHVTASTGKSKRTHVSGVTLARKAASNCAASPMRGSDSISGSTPRLKTPRRKSPPPSAPSANDQVSRGNSRIPASCPFDFCATIRAVSLPWRSVSRDGRGPKLRPPARLLSRVFRAPEASAAE